MTIPAPFAAWAQQRHWILWKLVKSAKLGAKPDKVPHSPYTGWKHDPTDVKHHVTYDEAQAVVALHGCHGVGYVFTSDQPYWFLDIDGARLGNTWSALAMELYAALPGAAFEVSQSGDGIHLFGSYRGIEPPHRSKDIQKLGLELYTNGRFAAVTFDRATGDVRTDLTHQLYAVIGRYFPADTAPPVPGAPGAGGTVNAWEDRADPTWQGPADDDELVAAMCSAKPSFGQVLGSKASPRELWTRDVDALSNAFPDSWRNPPRAYDESTADEALLQHLAFWTGRNTERMRRLMWKSALRRDKWTDHKSYLWISTVRACGRQSTVLRSKVVPLQNTMTSRPAQMVQVAAPEAPVVPVPGLAIEVPSPGRGEALVMPEQPGDLPPGVMLAVPTVMPSGGQWITPQQQVTTFRGCVYVRDLHRAFVPDGGLLKPDAFRAHFGGYMFGMDSQNEKTTSNAWEVFTESRAMRFPRVEACCFRPEIPAGSVIAEEGRKLVNLFVAIETPRRPGDASLFVDHVKRLLPDPRDFAILMAYMAALVQHQGIKFQWCPLIQGTEGNGKTVLTRCISNAIGHRYTHLPNSKALGEGGSTFNSWISCRLFIGVEEITFKDRADIFDALKPLITNDRIEIQAKGVDQVTGDNRANFIAMCNGKTDIAVGIDKRRYCIFYTAQQSAADCERDGMDARYFNRLWSWLRREGYAVVHDYLRTYRIPDELNPATLLTRAPVTTSTAEMLELSMSPIEQEIAEAIDASRAGFANGWVSSLALDKLLDASTRGRAVARRNRRDMMERLGYEWHPGLTRIGENGQLMGGRVNNPIPIEGGKPVLYIRKGHIASNLRSCADIVDRYLADQGYTSGYAARERVTVPVPGN